MEETKKQCLCRPCEPCADALRDAITRARVGELEWILKEIKTIDMKDGDINTLYSRAHHRIRKIKGADDGE